MKPLLRTAAILSVSLSSSLTLGCYSASANDESDESGTSGGNGGSSSGSAGANGSGGGSAGTTSGNAGRGGSNSGGSGGSSAGSAGAGGSSGGGPSECSIDSYTFAVSQTTSSCGFALPDLYDPTITTIYFTVGGSQQPICRHADSQGCALSDGYWWTGDEIALCDETCGLLDVEGGSFVAERGCETEYCSY